MESGTTQQAASVQDTFPKQWDPRLFHGVFNRPYMLEAFKKLRAAILHPKYDQPVPKTVLVTSALPQEGKSFVAANFAISLAQAIDQHALLVDCDMRRPSLSYMFGGGNDSGLVDYLQGTVALNRILMKTGVNKLSLLPAGPPPANPGEILTSAKMEALIKEVSSRYEDRFVVIDSPPSLVAAETNVIAGLVDAVVIVVRQGVSGKKQVEDMLNSMQSDKVLGVVCNDFGTNLVQQKYLSKSSGGYGSYYY